MKAQIARLFAPITRRFQSISRKNRILLGVLAVPMLLVPLLFATAPEPMVVESEESTWSVTTMAAQPATVAPEVALFGRVETPRTALLTSAVNAQVDAVHVREGDTVERDQLLIKLDDRDAVLIVKQREADVAEAEANLESLRLQHQDNLAILKHERALNELAQKKVAWNRELRDTRAISEDTLNNVIREGHQQAISLQVKEGLVANFENLLHQAEARLSRSQANLEEAVIMLERTEIRAPFSGRVTRVDLAPGERVTVGKNLAELYDTDSLEVRAQIPSRILARLGHSVDSLDVAPLEAEIDLGQEVIPCTLTRLSGMVKQGSSGVDGFFSVRARDHQLALGRVVDVTLRMPAEENVVKVPIQSIYGDDRVFVVEDERLLGVTVDRVGELTDDAGHYYILVRAPELIPGTPIITTQLSNALTGMKVSINNADSALVAGRSERTEQPS